MSESQLIYNLFYFLISFCVIYPPNEFVSAGVTINQIFSSLLGIEDIAFIQYHIKRTTLTFFIHSLLPFGYIFFYYRQFDFDYESQFTPTAIFWYFFELLAIIAPLTSLAVIVFWSRNNWTDHPICKSLKKFSNNERWENVAAQINVEFRRNDKITMKINAISTVIATENWIIKTTPYRMYFAHQSDTLLVADKSDTHTMSIDTSDSIQFVNIQVKTTRRDVPQFIVRINSDDFKDLQTRISRPIEILSNVRLQGDVINRFVEVFKEQALLNPKYKVDSVADSCFACMLTEPNVKLQKNCSDLNEYGVIMPESEQCGHCYCRPMWCIDCVGKWFATRQDQQEKHLWLNKKSTCPMCRSTFCMLDVCYVEKE